MALYHSSVVPHLNRVPEHQELGANPAMAHGHEFDSASLSYNTHQQTNNNITTSSTTTPTSSNNNHNHNNNNNNITYHNHNHNHQSTHPPPTRAPPASYRPRPVSMPPQAYNILPQSNHLPSSQPSTATPTTAIPEHRMTPSVLTTAPIDDASSKDGSSTIGPQSKRPRDTHSSGRSRTNRLLGDYTLSKTLGAGSMGKVKLATHNVTGEKLAVKILPRVYPQPPPANGAMTESAAKQASKDASKEIRTLREAALSMLLYHPYICGMREMIIHQHHYYMIFEYVNGGQMLDYIISHGRLRERVARKFARQIGSAIDYCHQNSVVHRDLKIENILISQTGNIKIIDFGLSNLYDPAGHLSTFCGSLYFAAPELLNARVYTGPEVDVWSFGVVLYVLVCGKVPFDDQSMPALHAKIKRGLVEYPVWLSAECKHLLSRMLVTSPAARATLHEVLNHPWMLRGHSGPPDAHLVHREPLRADELDRQVIRGMKGFEFGTEEEIERRLVRILESDAYIRSVQHWERKRNIGTLNGSSGITRWGESFSNSSLAISFDGSTTKLDPPTPSKKNRRFSGFDYYRRKLFSPASSPPSSPQSHSPPGSQNHLLMGPGGFAGETHKEPLDPTRGFHPLISMYYLAREKMERERVYGPGHFASSQLSVLDNVANNQHTSVSATSEDAASKLAQAQQQYTATQQQQPHHTAPVRKDGGTTGKPDYSMPLPRLPAPDPSHYSAVSYDTGVPSPTTPTFHPQPRARDLGLPPTGTNVGPATPTTPVGPVPQPQRRPVEADQQALGAGSVKGRLPRAPPAGAHRRSHSLSQRPTVLGRGWGSVFGHGHGSYQQGVDEQGGRLPEPPRTVGPEVTTFPVPSAVNESVEDREREEVERQQQQQQGHHGGLVSGGATLVRKFGSLLVGKGGGEEGKKGYGTKRGLGPSPRPSSDALKEKEREKEKEGEPAPVSDQTTPNPNPPSANVSPAPVITASASENTSGAQTLKGPTPLTTSVSQPIGSVHRRAATILDPQGRQIRHERRSSTGAALLTGGGAGGTIGRHRRPSTGYSTTSGHGRPFVERLFSGSQARETDVAEGREDERVEREYEAGVDPEHELEQEDEEHEKGKEEKVDEKEFKPVFLKGLFSVATTSSKSPFVIKADLRRVLDRMQVQYRETKTGFECVHAPSIDMSSVEPTTVRAGQGHYQQGSSTFGAAEEQGHGNSPQSHKHSIVKKASKLSFGMRREKGKEREREKEREKEKDQQQPAEGGVQGQVQVQGRLSGATNLTATPSSGSSSFFNVSSNHTVVAPEQQQQQQQQMQGGGVSASDHQQHSPPRSYSPVSNKAKVLPPIPRDFAVAPTVGGSSTIVPPRSPSPSPLPTGGADRDAFDNVGKNSLSVRFEINIVKVPWLPLHGIQFRRTSGDGWQYQMLARRVLTELKL